MTIDLVRDVLDSQLVDRKRRRIGKVDGLVLVLEERGRPRVAAIEVGSVVLAQRLHPRLARWIAARLRPAGASWEAFRIPWSKVRDVGMDIEVDLIREQTRLYAWQRRLWRKVLGRIPGG